MKTRTKARPDKQKIVDEVWDDDRVRSFLNTSVPRQSGEPLPGDRDYYILLRAYQAMRIHDFERFLSFFVAEGGDLHCENGKGQTISEYLKTHRKATPFLEAISSYTSS